MTGRLQSGAKHEQEHIPFLKPVVLEAAPWIDLAISFWKQMNESFRIQGTEAPFGNDW